MCAHMNIYNLSIKFVVKTYTNIIKEKIDSLSYIITPPVGISSTCTFLIRAEGFKGVSANVFRFRFTTELNRKTDV